MPDAIELVSFVFSFHYIDGAAAQLTWPPHIVITIGFILQKSGQKLVPKSQQMN